MKNTSTILYTLLSLFVGISAYFLREAINDIKHDISETREDVKKLLVAAGASEVENKNLDKRIQFLENKSVLNTPIKPTNNSNQEPLFVKLIFKHEDHVEEITKKRS
jgi:regulator of replication initiation timing